MPQLSGFPQAFHAVTSNVDTSAQVPVGTRAVDLNGGEWVYARGTASVATGDFCTFVRGDFSVERSSANDIGMIGVAGSAIVASRFGWYQIWGIRSGANVATGATAQNELYLTSTAGRVGTTDVAGDFVIGALLQVNSAANEGTVFLNYPMVTDNAID